MSAKQFSYIAKKSLGNPGGGAKCTCSFLLKKFLSLILSVLVVGMSLPHVAWADEPTSGDCGDQGDNVTWSLNLDNGKLTISGEGAMIFGRPSAPWRGSREKITSVEIGNGVTSIGEFAFDSCTNLTSITIPDSVTKIGACAFYGCSGLESIDIPSSVTKFEYGAFLGTPWLAAKQQKNPLVIIHNLLIDGTTASGYVTIPDGVTSIQDGAFIHNNNLTKITIPNSVTSIEDNAFYGCSGLTSITIPCDFKDEIFSTPGSDIVKAGDKYTVSGTDASGTFEYVHNLSYEDNGKGKHIGTCQNEECCKKTMDGNYTTKAEAHTFGELVNTDPDKHYKECICGSKEDEEPHSGGTATCTAKAKCEKCNADYGELVAHTLENVPAKAATCKEDGNIEYWRCSVCDKLFLDNEGKKETTPAGVTDHKWDEGVETKAPTYLEDGIITYTCKNCEEQKTGVIPKLTHDDPTAGVQYWGTREVHNGHEMYVDDEGKTSALVTGNKQIWLREESYDPSAGQNLAAWYMLDNTSGEFEKGSRFSVQWLNNKDNPIEFLKHFNNIDQTTRDRIDSNRVWIFSAGVTKPDGKTEYKTLPKEIPLYIQMGTDWDYSDIKAIYISDSEDEEVCASYLNMEYPGGKGEFAKLGLKHFSPYAIYDYLTDEEKAETESSSSNQLKTGDETGYMVFVSALICAAATLVIFKKKKVR